MPNFQNKDIMESDLKSRRFKWLCYVYPSSWAWLRDFRKYNKTKKMYDCDPYAEVYQIRDNVYSIFSENCDGAGDMWEYLVVGPEKALLVDTGYGLGDIKALCDEITGGKELYVVNTHYGVDHALGNCRFDRVYCHKTLKVKLETQNEHSWDYMYENNHERLGVEFPREDLPKWKPYEIIGVEDGYKFDLGGGYEIELIHTGGHMDHHAVYLDRQNKALFCGDIICSSSISAGRLSTDEKHARQKLDYPEYGTLAFFRERLAYILSRGDEFDFVFPGHYINDVDKEVLMEELDTIDQVLEDPDCYDFCNETKNYRGEARILCYKLIPGFGALQYFHEPEDKEQMKKKLKPRKEY